MTVDGRSAQRAGKGPAPAPDAALACAQTFMDLVPSLMDAVRQHMRAAAPSGLSVPQMRLLIFARRHGGASLSALAEHLGVTLPTVSVAARRLLASGLLENRADLRDRRRSAIWLTSAGEAVVLSARQRSRVDVAARLCGADADTLARIQSGLRALAQTLQTPDAPSPKKPGTPSSRPVTSPHP